jgi:antitoxin component YwqK of YwqJK toxin-antitoxin module
MTVDHPADMPRILDDELGYDGDVRLLNGEPFTGTSYSEYSDGQLEQETMYRDGLPDGLQKEWYENGQLQRESNAVRGLGSSKVVTWYENGQMKSAALYEAGVKVENKEWTEDGELIKDEVITPSPELKAYIERMKKIKGA